MATEETSCPLCTLGENPYFSEVSGSTARRHWMENQNMFFSSYLIQVHSNQWKWIFLYTKRWSLQKHSSLPTTFRHNAAERLQSSYWHIVLLQGIMTFIKLELNKNIFVLFLVVSASTLYHQYIFDLWKSYNLHSCIKHYFVHMLVSHWGLCCASQSRGRR